MTKTRRYQIASGWVLTDEIPDNYFDWDEDRQNYYLRQHVTEEYQHHNAKGLWDAIESMEGFLEYTLKEEESYVKERKHK